MRGNEFLDKMELIDPAYIEAADIQPNKKKSVWVKWGAMAACLCLLLVGAFALGSEKAPELRPVPNPDGTVRYEPVPEVWPEHPILRPGDEGYIAPEPTPEPMPDLAPEDPVSNNGAFLPNNVTEFPDVKPHISAYGEMAAPADMAVSNGGVYISQPLRAAMEHYGDTANYHVLIELYSDGVQIPSGGETAQKEMQRFSELGYTFAFETHKKTETHGELETVVASYYFTIPFAELALLTDFPASDSLGYHLMLYGEYFGTEQPDTVVFNSDASAAN